jgi:hypothetical protein
VNPCVSNTIRTRSEWYLVTSSTASPSWNEIAAALVPE